MRNPGSSGVGPAGRVSGPSASPRPSERSSRGGACAGPCSARRRSGRPRSSRPRRARARRRRSPCRRSCCRGPCAVHGRLARRAPEQAQPLLEILPGVVSIGVRAHRASLASVSPRRLMFPPRLRRKRAQTSGGRLRLARGIDVRRAPRLAPRLGLAGRLPRRLRGGRGALPGGRRAVLSRGRRGATLTPLVTAGLRCGAGALPRASPPQPWPPRPSPRTAPSWAPRASPRRPPLPPMPGRGRRLRRLLRRAARLRRVLRRSARLPPRADARCSSSTAGDHAVERFRPDRFDT